MLPDGSPMTVERLQLMGSDFGMKPSFERMHWIIDHAFADGDGTLSCGASVSDSFLMRAFERTNTRTNPLYWTLQEFIYADGDTMPIRWAAAEEKAHRAEFDTLARPLMFTGEAMFPWMFEQMPELKPFKPAMDLLMEDTSWDKIYDPQRLGLQRGAAPGRRVFRRHVRGFGSAAQHAQPRGQLARLGDQRVRARRSARQRGVQAPLRRSPQPWRSAPNLLAKECPQLPAPKERPQVPPKCR